MISNCPTDACKHGKCRELVNNYWCECDQGYMLSGRECVPYTETALKKNADGTVSVSGTMTLWQDPAPAMSFGYEAAEQYCSSSRLAGFADWQVPSGVALNKLCVINAASPVLADITAPYWIASPKSGSTGVERVVSCDANGIEMARSDLEVARVRCVHAPTD